MKRPAAFKRPASACKRPSSGAAVSETKKGQADAEVMLASEEEVAVQPQASDEHHDEGLMLESGDESGDMPPSAVVASGPRREAPAGSPSASQLNAKDETMNWSTRKIKVFKISALLSWNLSGYVLCPGVPDGGLFPRPKGAAARDLCQSSLRARGIFLQRHGRSRNGPGFVFLCLECPQHALAKGRAQGSCVVVCLLFDLNC